MIESLQDKNCFQIDPYHQYCVNRIVDDECSLVLWIRRTWNTHDWLEQRVYENLYDTTRAMKERIALLTLRDRKISCFIFNFLTKTKSTIAQMSHIVMTWHNYIDTNYCTVSAPMGWYSFFYIFTQNILWQQPIKSQSYFWFFFWKACSASALFTKYFLQKYHPHKK